MSDVLIYTEVKIRKDEVCSNLFKKFFNPYVHFCVGGLDNKEVCPVSILLFYMFILIDIVLGNISTEKCRNANNKRS